MMRTDTPIMYPTQPGPSNDPCHLSYLPLRPVMSGENLSSTRAQVTCCVIIGLCTTVYRALGT